ncbi:MAG: hypothetical protein MI919_38570 [Holophagales bacterium]|nr:hypothetical protein [Holophagales bacterium]
MYSTRDKKLGQMLVERGWITGEQLIRAIQSQRMVGGRIGTCLLEMDVLDEDTLLDALSDQLQVEPARVEQLRGIEEPTLSLLPPKVARRCLAVPFFANDNEVKVATLHVRNLGFLDELAFCTNKKVRPFIANEVRVYEALEKYYRFEIPRRYGHLLDRLNRSRYLWDESAKILLGNDSGEIVWTSPDEAFGNGGAGAVDGLIPAASARAGGHRPAGAAGADGGKSATGLSSGAGSVAAPGSSLPFSQRGGGETPSPAASSPAAAAPISAAPQPAPQAESPLETRPMVGLSTVVAAAEAAARPGPRPLSQPAPAEPPETEAAAPGPLEAPELPAELETLETLDDVDRALGRVDDANRIAEVLLGFSLRRMARVGIFSLRPDGPGYRARGWRLRGQNCDEALFRSYEVGASEASIFSDLEPESEAGIRALSPEPAHRKLASCWGGELPAECLLVPIRLRDRLVSVLYCDQGSRPLEDFDIEPFHRLALKAAMAFELCILRKKIRDV